MQGTVGKEQNVKSIQMIYVKINCTDAFTESQTKNKMETVETSFHVMTLS